MITSLILPLRTARTRESCFVQPIHCYLSRLMSRFQITYLPMIWLIIWATILYRRLNVSMTHWTPFSHLSLSTAMAMRKLCWSWSARMCRVPKLQDLDTRPSFFAYWKGSHEILSLRSCTYICVSTGSWCAVTGNHLYDQHVVWIWSVRRGMEAGPRITHVKEVWLRHRVQKLSPSKQSPVCFQVIWKRSCWSIDWSYDDQWSAPWATVGLQEIS